MESAAVTTDRILIDTGPSPRGWHRVESFLTCPMRYYWRRVAKVEMEPTFPLVRGTLGHVMLAHHYAQAVSRVRGLDPAKFYSPLEASEIIAQRYGALGVEARQHAYRGFTRHCQVYATESFEVIGIEKLLDTHFEGFLYTARADLVVRASTGKVWIYDHKFCLAGRTEIETSEGIFSVEELADLKTPWATATLAGPAGIRWRQAQAKRTDPKPVCLVGLSNGLHLRCSHDHPILTPDGYVDASKLLSGSLVAVAGQLPDRVDANIPDALLTVAGALLADGSYVRDSIRWFKRDEGCRAAYTAALTALGVPFAVEANGTVRARGWTRGPLHDLLRQIGMSRARSEHKTIPLELTALSARQAAILLRALWSGDGCSKIKAGSTSVRIVYGSRSIVLCLGIQRLLFQQGILSTVTSSSVAYRGSRRPYHFVTVVGRASKVKMLELLRGAPRVGKTVADCLAAIESSRSLEGPQRNPTLCQDGTWWVPVESITFDHPEPMFDVTVKDAAHNFVAGGIVTHNCGRIEDKTIRRYTLSGQFLGLHHLGRATYGHDFGGVIVNVVGCNDGKCARPAPAPAPWALQRFPKNVANAERQIKNLEEAGDVTLWPMAVSEYACYTPYGPCDFFDRCRWGK